MSLSFVVFSDDWGEHPSSSQHLFGQLAGEHSVIWVNTIGMRRPTLTLTDLRKIVSKVGRMLNRTPGGVRRASANIRVCHPFMLPYSNFDLVRRINAASLGKAVREVVRAAGLDRPVVVSTVPNACDYVRTLPDQLVVYYCVDDFSAWPGLDEPLVRDMEAQLIARSDVILASSQTLYERLASHGKPIHLLTHGVDVELFSQETSDEHPCLAGLPRPRAGYFGLIDERTDKVLVAALAARMPDVTFVFTGRVETQMEPLQSLANVRFTGPVPYHELPCLIAGLDVLLLPYAATEFAETLSPLKLKEYIVTGKPIVSTPIAEARRMSEFLSLASSVDEWELAIREALRVDVAARKVRAISSLRNEAWTAKAATLLGICSAALQQRARE